MYRVLMHSSIDEHLGCFQVLAVVNSAPMNIGVCFQIMVFFGYMPSNGIVRLFGSSVFRFFKEWLYCSPQGLYQFTVSPAT